MVEIIKRRKSSAQWRKTVIKRRKILVQQLGRLLYIAQRRVNFIKRRESALYEFIFVVQWKERGWLQLRRRTIFNPCKAKTVQCTVGWCEITLFAELQFAAVRGTVDIK